jgi:hypothetical protein
MSMPTPPTPLQIDYIDPDGNDWNLSDVSMAKGYICAGITGIEGLSVSMQTVPLLDGTAVPNIYIPQPGTITIAILVERPVGGTENDYYTLLDRIVRAFINRRNEIPVPSSLIVQRPNGNSRQIQVYQTSGLNTPEVGIHNSLYTFTLQTPDPYWSDLTPQSLTFSVSSVSGILPLLPVQLASSAVIGNATIPNNGTAIAYPTWTITGPGTPTMQNLTTGRKWSLNTSIPGGQVVQVTTKPGSQAVVNVTTGVSIWDQLVLSSLRDLWGFVGGNNNINIAMPGSTIATSVSLSWTSRWSRA